MFYRSSSTTKPTWKTKHRLNQEQYNEIIQNERDSTGDKEAGALTPEKRKKKGYSWAKKQGIKSNLIFFLGQRLQYPSMYWAKDKFYLFIFYWLRDIKYIHLNILTT